MKIKYVVSVIVAVVSLLLGGGSAEAQRIKDLRPYILVKTSSPGHSPEFRSTLFHAFGEAFSAKLEENLIKLNQSYGQRDPEWAVRISVNEKSKQHGTPCVEVILLKLPELAEKGRGHLESKGVSSFSLSQLDDFAQKCADFTVEQIRNTIEGRSRDNKFKINPRAHEVI